jgi:putative transposase
MKTRILPHRNRRRMPLALDMGRNAAFLIIGDIHVSLLTLAGRVLIPFVMGSYQESRVDAIKGQADLLYRNGTFYLAVTLEVPTPEPQETGAPLGVDLGIVNLATDSEGESFSGELVERNRKRHTALRQRLQR